jgi:[protein-PII] uridylyltransferase
VETHSHQSATASSRLDEARRELSAEAASGRSGRAALARFSDRIDELVQSLVAAAPVASQPVAVLALGGYGRRQFCLHSDIDVLVLFGGPIGADEEPFLRGLLHPLWDLRFSVGHQTRHLDEFSRLERDNPEFLLALVDARWVAGDRSLVERMTGAIQAPEARARTLESLEKLIDERHARFNDTLYQLEPDVRDAPGGLRDLAAVSAIATLTDPALLDREPAERARLAEAEEFLLRIRSILHLETKRNHNVLSHELQERAAALLGYRGPQPRQQVERLMSDYFRHARSVSRSLEWVRKAAPLPVGPNVVRTPEGIRFVDLEHAARHPESWLALFQAAIDSGAPVASTALLWIQQQVDRCAAEDFFPTAAERSALLTFLRPRAGLYARLSEMHDCGLLGRMLPEFQMIFCRVVRDFYHKYTVDEHTLLTIRNLERLITRSAPGRERFSALAEELIAPELLVLALLFHDVGKWRDDEHVSESLRLARQALDRLQIPPDARAPVEFLIEHHLQMSLVAFRRDTEDPEIVRRFADLVGIEERLKMLCLMTVADIEAVSPNTLTSWRAELLWRLYVDTYNHLTLEYGDELIARTEAELASLVAGAPADVAGEEISRFVAGLPRRYLRLFTRDAVYRHVRLSRDIRPDDVHAALERRGPVWELTVVTLDKPSLFSNICGVLSSFGMDILRGHAMTNPNGLVLDIFEFTDRDRFLELNADGERQFLRQLEAAISGATDVSARLRSREQSVLHARSRLPASQPVIHSDNHSSRRYTILEIVATDRLGLLHRVSRAMSRHGCDIDLVLISTEGKKAIDVFHITHAGHKLPEAALVAMTADLQRVLEGGDEAD